jgi:hypothetical protein
MKPKDFLIITLMALLLVTVCSPICAECKEKSKSAYDKAAEPAGSSESGVATGAAHEEELSALSALPDVTESSSRESSAPGLAVSSTSAVIIRPPDAPEAGVQWKALTKDSLFYLGVMHSFRLATEAGTREGLHNSVVGGYFEALGAMHGWSDGDGYYENYLGHPIQGAVSGYIWVHNDPRYRAVQFGADRDYWMSRLRAYAFAWAFSEQFEIGPISEASIGQIQRYCCAYGFVDHVITPNGALAWMLAGDALDRYVTVPLENRTHNTAARILARVALNPTQSFANLMMFQYPWRRENRATVTEYNGVMYLRRSGSLAETVNPAVSRGPFDLVPKIEVVATVPGFYRVGGLSCPGGGAVGALRASDFWQWTLEVSGCTLGNSLPRNWSGDSLTFTFGPQWIVHTAGRWSPHAHFRVGGQKITEEKSDPELKKRVLAGLPKDAKTSKYRDLYTQHWETTGFSLSVGGGLDVGINRALAVRVANIDYTRSWLGTLNGTNFDHGLRFSTGLVLRIGTW